jgi:imidazolonepropionase-like amidohydrolase
MIFRSFIAGLLAFASTPALAETVVVHAGRLITDAAQRPAGPSTITVVDGRISAIAQGHQPAPAGARLVDLRDKTVLPGLIDTHTHLSGDPGGDFWREAIDTDAWSAMLGVKNAQITARAGFTTVRDVGAPRDVIFALRRATAEGVVPGPRILTSGSSISIIGGHADVSGFRPEVNEALQNRNTCTGAEQCAQRVREASRDGADLIKITATGGVLSQQARGLGQHFTDPELKAIVDTAHSLGLKVAAHAHGARGIEAAARARVDSIEHGTFADARALQAMKASGTALVPTLMAFTGIREGLGRNAYTPAVAAKVRSTLNDVGKAAKAARAAGVPSCSAPTRPFMSMAATPRNSPCWSVWRDEPGRSDQLRDDGRGAAARAGERNRPDRAGLFGRPHRHLGRSAPRCPRAGEGGLGHGPRPRDRVTASPS